MAPARLAGASAAAALLFASAAFASNFASAAPGGFLSYSDFAGTPYTVTYDNRRCVCARGAVCAGSRAIERAKGPLLLLHALITHTAPLCDERG
jgi:hypothetical protein